MTKSKKNSHRKIEPIGELPAVRMSSLLPRFSDKELEILADKLIDWAHNDENALKLSQFPRKYDILYEEFLKWAERSKKLTKAIEEARRAIGDRRELLALTHKANASIVMRTMALYDREYKAHYEWEAKLRNKEEEVSNEPRIVVIERYQHKPDPNKSNEGNL